MRKKKRSINLRKKRKKTMAKKRGEFGEEEHSEEEATALPVPAATIRAQTLDLKTGKLVDSKPTDLDEYEGGYTKKDGDPEESYGLKVVENDPRGNTHHAKSNDHYWEGTEQQFKEQFDEGGR
jgi:hypothetical protein